MLFEVKRNKKDLFKFCATVEEEEALANVRGWGRLKVLSPGGAADLRARINNLLLAGIISTDDGPISAKKKPADIRQEEITLEYSILYV